MGAVTYTKNWTPPIRFQIIEKPGSELQKKMVAAMRSGDLRTFLVQKRGKKVTHTNKDHPGWMNWASRDGVISCEILSPRRPGAEWRLFSAFLGRLADRYRDHIVCLNVQFPGSVPAQADIAKRRKRRA